MCQLLGIPRRARMDISFLLASKSGKKQGGWGGEETDLKQKNHTNTCGIPTVTSAVKEWFLERVCNSVI